LTLLLSSEAMVIGRIRIISVVHRLQVISRCCLHYHNNRGVHSLLVPLYSSSLQHCVPYSLHARMAGAQLHEHAVDFYNIAVTSVLPRSMVDNALKRDGDRLTVGDCWHTLQHNVHIVAFGKAVIGMVRAAEEALGDHIVGGIASVPWGIQDTLKQLGKWYVDGLLLRAFCTIFLSSTSSTIKSEQLDQ